MIMSGVKYTLGGIFAILFFMGITYSVLITYEFMHAMYMWTHKRKYDSAVFVKRWAQDRYEKDVYYKTFWEFYKARF